MEVYIIYRNSIQEYVVEDELSAKMYIYYHSLNQEDCLTYRKVQVLTSDEVFDIITKLVKYGKQESQF